MRISDWSSDVCSSDLAGERLHVTLVVEDKGVAVARRHRHPRPEQEGTRSGIRACPQAKPQVAHAGGHAGFDRAARAEHVGAAAVPATGRSEEHTSELQSQMRNSIAVFCLKKKYNKSQTPYYL